MNTWKKFLLKIFKNNYEKSNGNNQNQTTFEERHDHIRTIETRVKYKYPKGEFRFPLIKDPPKNEQRKPLERTKRHTDQTLGKSEASYTVQKVERKRNQPFTPTHIPSPIYGFNRPKKENFEQRVEKEELESGNQQAMNDIDSHSLSPPIFHKHSTEEVKSNTQQLNETTNNLPCKQSESIHQREEGQTANADSLDVEHQLKEKEEIKAKSNVDKRSSQRKIKESQKTKQPSGKRKRSLSERKEKQERTNIPFNVLMLRKDRKNWERQQRKDQHKKTRLVNEIDSQATESAATLNKEQPVDHGYQYPSLQLLKPPVAQNENKEWLNEQATLLDETLENFNVKARVVGASQGPSVTRFEVQPDKGVKVNRITNLSDDIKLSMAAKDIRIEAPIPGKRSVGIELPNHESRPVQISEIIRSETFLQHESPLTAALGLDISGKPVVTDVKKMPHGLIAGATGSGKSVCINSILISFLYKANPDELKLLLIDPKMVELAPYNGIPHLVSPVITDVKAATAALKWAVEEMERRYELFAQASVRDLNRFNELAAEDQQKRLPYIVIVIDELADLMMMAPADVEESICRIAQKARACGIHLLIATQRPSVDVITGLIKANVPTRIAFSVSSQVDSRTVIDIGGAEKLLGRGDMLFLDNGTSKPRRLQGTFVSDEEIDLVIDHVKRQGEPNYLFEQEQLLKKAAIEENEDELYMEACEFVVEHGNASTSLLQRKFRIGYNRAARLIAMMEEQGIISEARGSRPRDILVTEADFEL